MKQLLLYLAVLLLPFQHASISLYGNGYDLSSIFFFAYILIVALEGIRGVNFAGFLLFYVWQISVFFAYSQAPISRFLSSTFWVGGIILGFCVTVKNSINFSKVFYLIIFGGIINAVAMYWEFFQGIERPKGFFYEPSFAGLFMYGVSAGLIYLFISTSRNAFEVLKFTLLLIFLGASVMTKSSHIVAFTIILICMSVFLWKPLNIKKHFLMIVALMSLTLVLFYFIYSSDHLQARFSGDGTLSTWNWLFGMEQAIYVLYNAPILGMGAGSTGEFYFPTDYWLRGISPEDSNIKDAYSLAFRLIIEYGLLFFIIIIYKIISIFVYTSNLISSFSKENLTLYQHQIFLFIFSSTLLIGDIIKEPVYSRSYVFGVFFLFIISSYIPSKYFMKNVR